MSGTAIVGGHASVLERAVVTGAADVYDNASVRGDARVGGSAQVYGSALLLDHSAADDDAEVYDDARLEELLHTLRELFAPIAPTVWIGRGDDTPPPLRQPPSTAGMRLVAWQHRGDGVDRRSKPSRTFQVYKSVRTHRPEPLAVADSGCVGEEVDLALVAGKRVRVSAWLRGASVGMSSVHLAIPIYVPNREQSLEEQYQSPRLEVGSAWARRSFERDVAADALYAWAEACLYYEGAVEVDDLTVEVAEGDSGWTQVPLRDPSFESWDDEPRRDQTGYEIVATKTDAHHGVRVAKIARAPGMLPGGMLVDHAGIGEQVTVDLVAGLVARVPLALWSDREHTLPRADPAPLTSQLAQASVDSADDVDVRLGAVVIAWSALEHFYPYFDVVATDWDAALVEALSRALGDADERAFATTLEVMLEHLQDGHAHISHERLRNQDGQLPIALDWIEDQLLVTASADSAVPIGHRVVAVDGRPTDRWRDAQEALISGTPQWKRRGTVDRLLAGPIGSRVELDITGPDGATRSVTLTRVGDDRWVHERSEAAIRSFDDGIYYVDLDRASWAEIEARLPAIAAAPAVVFDLRGYPNSNHKVLGHLLEAPDEREWMFTPLLSRPRAAAAASFEADGWELQAASPHIGVAVVFLTDGRAISYAESVMGFVEGYQMGAIVGTATAGANGNVKTVELPVGFAVGFTGMKVLRHDGARLHAVGIPPTHQARRTVAGVRAGRDEVLEAGLRLLRERLGERRDER